MSSTYGACASAFISPPRILRSQTQDRHFFTPSLLSVFFLHSNWLPRALSRSYGLDVCYSNARHFTTSHYHQAVVAASILNLDFLRPSHRKGSWNSLDLAPPGSQHIRTSPNSLQIVNSYRHVSKRSRSFLQWCWPPTKKPGESALRPDDLPLLPSFLNDANGSILGRSKVGKPANEMKLRCTEVNENGDVTLVNGEFKKSELIAKYGLLPRDLRKIDSSLLPHILIRPSAILINLLHLRVLIKHDRVLILDAYGTTDSTMQSVFMYDLSGKLRQKDTSRQAGGLPYEFRALEAVLVSVTTGLEQEFEGVSEPVVRVLRELEEDIDRDKLRHLLIYSKRLGTFEQKARLVRDAIDDLLDADDDLVAMYLTERAQGKIREEANHTEVEMLLESYHKVCDEIVQVSGNLVSNIRNTEEIVKAILDANRNSLMLLDLKFSIGTLGLGSGALIAGLYGMNLKNFMEESDIGFIGVTGSCFIFAAVVCGIGLHKLRRVQRVSMWGDRRRIPGGRGSWNQVEPGFVGPGIRGRSLAGGPSQAKKVLPMELQTLSDLALPAFDTQTWQEPPVDKPMLKKRSLWSGEKKDAGYI